MNRIIYGALLLAGVALVIYGVNASHSIGSDFSRFFTNSPTEKSIWLLIAGCLAGVTGAVGLLRGSKAI